MADFLSDEWFDSVNAAMALAGAVPDDVVTTHRIVLEFVGAPSTTVHAITFTVGPTEATLTRGDHLAADAIVRLSYEDALALTSGTLDSASALREGRLKVRGDIHAIVPLLSWLQRAHPNAEL